MPRNFSRPFSKTSGRRSLLASQSVTQWNGWDISLPSSYSDGDVAAFSDSDLKKFEDEVIRRLAPLLEHQAVDAAHGAVLDKTVAAVFAPVFEHVWETHHLNVRSLEALDGQGRNTARKLAEQAAHKVRLARDAEAQADSVYQEYVGLTRDDSNRTDWNAEAAAWDEIGLALAPATATAEYSSLGFRGSRNAGTAATDVATDDEE